MREQSPLKASSVAENFTARCCSWPLLVGSVQALERQYAASLVRREDAEAERMDGLATLWSALSASVSHV